jgi:hypothetical protein
MLHAFRQAASAAMLAAPALLLSAALPAPAAAQNVGTYAAQGTSPDGSTYTGTVQYQSAGNNTWRVTWRIPGQAPIIGSAISNGRNIAAGYVLEGVVGVILYEEQAGGVLVGRWTTRDGGVGTERLTPR